LGVIDTAVYYCITHAEIVDTFHPPTFRSSSDQMFMSNIQVVEDTVVTRFSAEICCTFLYAWHWSTEFV